MENKTAPTFEFLKEFLNSGFYRNVLTEFNEQSAYKLDTRQLPDKAYDYTFSRLLRSYAFLNLSMDDVAQYFQAVKPKLVLYTISCIRFFMKEPENLGDYPKSEGPGKESNSEPTIYHGIAPTILLDKIAELYLLEAGDTARLIDYLKVTRMPGAKKYAGQINKLFKQIKP